MEVVKEGVYFLYDKDELVYIGQSDNMLRRIGQHIAENIKWFTRFELYPTTDRIRLESFLIEQYKPKYNIASGSNWRDKYNKDIFPCLEIEESIRKYEEYKSDPIISDIADEIGTYRQCLLRGLWRSGAPIYKLYADGYFRLDKKWYDEHKTTIWNYVE